MSLFSLPSYPLPSTEPRKPKSAIRLDPARTPFEQGTKSDGVPFGSPGLSVWGKTSEFSRSEPQTRKEASSVTPKSCERSPSRHTRKRNQSERHSFSEGDTHIHGLKHCKSSAFLRTTRVLDRRGSGAKAADSETWAKKKKTNGTEHASRTWLWAPWKIQTGKHSTSVRQRRQQPGQGKLDEGGSEHTVSIRTFDHTPPGQDTLGTASLSPWATVQTLTHTTRHKRRETHTHSHSHTHTLSQLNTTHPAHYTHPANGAVHPDAVARSPRAAQGSPAVLSRCPSVCISGTSNIHTRRPS